MKRIRDRVGGLDVHRDSVTACARVVEFGEVVEDKERFSTTVAGLAALGTWLAGHGVTTVAMEATGVHWKPVGVPPVGRSRWLRGLVGLGLMVLVLPFDGRDVAQG